MTYFAIALTIFLTITISNELGWDMRSKQYWCIALPTMLLIETILIIIS